MQEPSDKTKDAKTIAVIGRWLGISRYDRVSSMLIALLCTIGAVTVLLFVVWLTGKLVERSRPPVPPTLLPPLRYGDNGGDGRAPGGSQLDTPSDEPVVGKDKETSGVKDNLIALSALADSKTLDVDDPEASEPTRHGSRGTRNGIYGGDGDGRGTDIGPGRPGPRKPVEPERNWEVTFASNTLNAYARQLDFFKIELGFVQPDNKIAYACNLTKSKPDKRIAATADEKRFYLTWRKGEMQKADKELLARAGIETGDGLALKFLPREVEAELADLEKRSADEAGKTLKEIRTTQFGIRSEGSGFSFFVLEQTYRR
jgi:hypothetical protein